MGCEPANAARDAERAMLKVLAQTLPSADAALAEIARLSAVLTMPKGTVHVISDIHGEDKKLRHIINNASGTLRRVVEKHFGSRLPPQELNDFLTLVFYPAEVTARFEQNAADAPEVRTFIANTLRLQLELVRVLSSQYSLRRAMMVFPKSYTALLLELVNISNPQREAEFLGAIIDALLPDNRALHLVHVIGRLIRNLAVNELIIGGDCWDRGPRGDRVVDYLMQQPNVSFIWGNHDIAWLGAALGNDALLCTVLRVTLRYRRISQIDGGYGIPMTPLEYLVAGVYKDDPATFFMPKIEGMRPKVVVARMQKAIAVMQFKLEGQLFAKYPQWKVEHRRLLHHIDLKAGTINVDGVTYPLRDTFFPTIDPNDPYTLTPEEDACLRLLRRSFAGSLKLAQHMDYLVRIGQMYLVRDRHLIFHGCVPCDKAGNFLPVEIDGKGVAGREMYDAIEELITRAWEKRSQGDIDFLWYLWGGPRSPLFGKDRMATFERDFITEKKPHHEQKDPYFDLIHEVGFCDKVLDEFGVDPKEGLIVNGHVPVKIEKGENPIKRSGKAITIDGAFSEAYGDRGYTLALEADRTVLALHHHFDSVEAAVRSGVDIIPELSVVREWPRTRKIGDTDRGDEIRGEIHMLKKLVEAYQTREIVPAQTPFDVNDQR
jgi:fructose-1,6-bisphosphatase-3